MRALGLHSRLDLGGARLVRADRRPLRDPTTVSSHAQSAKCERPKDGGMSKTIPEVSATRSVCGPEWRTSAVTHLDPEVQRCPRPTDERKDEAMLTPKVTPITHAGSGPHAPNASSKVHSQARRQSLR
jgi:hypothetical protein